MKLIFAFAVLLSSYSSFAGKASLKIASLNLQGWIDTSSKRAVSTKELFKTKAMMDGVSVFITQESIEQAPLSSTEQLAKELRWDSFSERRTSDNEGLGVLHPKKVDFDEILTLQLKSKSSATDFSRMAVTGILHHPDFGRVRIVNVHLAHQIGKSLTRKNQLREVITWIEGLEKSDPSDLLILGGDFNTGMTDVAYDGEFEILKKSVFQFKHVRPVGASYTFKDMKSGHRRLIDHFFVSHSNQLSIKSLETTIYRDTTDMKLSDHNLLILKIDI